MAKYIEREAAYQTLTEYYHHTTEGMHSALREAISRVPAADVRPVVMCRDCRYYYKDADGYEMCDNSEGYDHVTEDGFCAWAVKREES